MHSTSVEPGVEPLSQSRNLLLRALPASDATLLTPSLKRVELGSGDRIGAADDDIATVFFPETAIASCVERSNIEVGLIGREGLVGWSALLGATRSPYGSTVQLLGGSALAVPADRLRAICRDRPGIADLLLCFVQYFTEQMAQAIAASLRDQVETRLARWLLMLHDRMEGDEIALTHHDLSAILNVRRATITDCLHILEGDHVLTCTRARILIRDRVGLEQAAGQSYGMAEATYRNLIGDFGKGAEASAATADWPIARPVVAATP